MGKRNFKIDTVLEAIKDSGGIVSTIAAKLNCEWHTAYKYIHKHDETIRAFEDEENKILDVCQQTLIKSIKDGNTYDAKWYLSTKGRNRGFGDKAVIEHTGKDGGAIENKLTIEFIDTVNYDDEDQ